ncbi:hypothetical protein HMPREF1316_1267 [Olsenella profusa F0195]|uniref:Uncharacterized protein n=1 Tax=Olsenella profusa F0195 TaxID=1125712 RepID=U2V0T8_9ACTN|nr:hypothetical protein HMPREF1316_1267 [Olsenella profusa F0195]
MTQGKALPQSRQCATLSASTPQAAVKTRGTPGLLVVSLTTDALAPLATFPLVRERP